VGWLAPGALTAPQNACSGRGHPTLRRRMPRPRHQRKELEDVLQLVESRGWRVEKSKGYFRIKCPCGNHQRTVALTPSGGYYVNHLVAWLRRLPCWEAER
jgi:hypothetical protein